MNTLTAREMRDDYLRRLDAAISDIPHGLAVELRAGIVEELRGDDPEQLATRVHELGPPEEIAEAAIEAGFGAPALSPHSAQQASPATSLSSEPAPLSVSVVVASPSPLPLNQTRSYAIISAIILGIGGIVAPFVGWIAGALLVANSKLWSTGEKAWAILFPPIAIAVTGMLTTILYAVSATPAEQVNPLLPAPFDIVWTIVLVAAVVAPFTAIWLVLRLRRAHPDQA